LDDLAQTSARVSHEHPAAFEIDPEERRHTIGPSLGEQRYERGLVSKCRHVRLEVDITPPGRDAQHRRPASDVRLLDGSHGADTEPRELLVEPAVRSAV